MTNRFRVAICGLLVLGMGIETAAQPAPKRGPRRGPAANRAPAKRNRVRPQPPAEKRDLPSHVLPAGYGELADAMSNPIYSNPNYAATGTGVSKPEVLSIKVDNAEEGPIGAAKRQLKLARDGAFAKGDAVAKAAANADAAADSAIDAAQDGGFVSKKTFIQARENPDGSTQWVQREEEEDWGPLVMASGFAFKAYLAMNAPEAASVAALTAFEKSRLAVWNELIRNLDSIYPPAGTAQNLVTLRINEPDGDRLGELMAVNTSGRRLNEVTLVVDLIHFSTAPEATSRQVYYLGRWEPNGSPFLSLNYYPNLETPAKVPRWLFAAPSKSVLYPSPTEVDLWLRQAGGLMAAKVTVWEANARQPEQLVLFPKQAEGAARWLMKWMMADAGTFIENPEFMERLQVPLQRKPANARPKNQSQQKTIVLREPPLMPKAGAAVVLPKTMWAVTASETMIEMLPADSQMRADAELLLRDAREAVRVYRQREINALLAMLEPGTHFAAEWKIPRISGMRAGRPGYAPGVLAAGTADLEIVSRDDKKQTVSARMVVPESSPTPAQLSGKLVLDDKTKLCAIEFKTIGRVEKKQRTEAVKNALKQLGVKAQPKLKPAGFPDSVYEMVLRAKGANLEGTATGYDEVKLQFAPGKKLAAE